MNLIDSSSPSSAALRWTGVRQLRFLDALAAGRSVTASARQVGMSRESAYRFRRRPGNALFAAAWDRALAGHALVNFVGDRQRADCASRLVASSTS